MSKKFMQKKEELKCAPSKKYDEGSCFTLESLIRMTIAYNVKCHKTKQGVAIDIREDKKYLIAKLTKALKNVCSDQICWLEQDFIKDLNDAEINDDTFRPRITQGRFDWLNTTNIKEVMKQYENVYKDFLFLGALPLDFDDLSYYGIRNLNFDDLKHRGIKRLGFVFNLDESWQRGSHWVSMFVDLANNKIYYFDSYGKKPKKRICDLVNRIATWCYSRNYKGNVGNMTESAISESFMNKVKGKNRIEEIFESIDYNTTRHQYKHSECGVYSINFILRLLKGEDFDYICTNITSDDEINECRPIYFRFK